MDMWKYPIGTVVKDKYSNEWGHIVGFTKNIQQHPETTLVIKFSDGIKHAIHPSNVYVKEDFDDQ